LEISCWKMLQKEFFRMRVCQALFLGCGLQYMPDII
jgi:hypothetical protein